MPLEFYIQFADDGTGKPGVIECEFPPRVTVATMWKMIDQCAYVEKFYAGGKRTVRKYMTELL
jgi:hypothetical protein